MPYDIRKFENGFKVCKKGTKKCYSNDPIPYERAIKQRKAIGLSGGDFFDDEDFTKIINDNDNDNDTFDYTKDLKGDGKKYNMLELFKGTGSVGKVFKNDFNIVSLDLDPIYTPEIETDILDWDYKKWYNETKFTPNFIWASPPCNTFSVLAYKFQERDTKTAEPFSQRAKIGTKIAHKTIEIIKFFENINPNLIYVIENPKGMLRHDTEYKKLPFLNTTLYCLYEDCRRKPTDFWSNINLELKEPELKNCYTKGETPCLVKKISLEERYKIPAKLLKQIKNKVMKHLEIKGGNIDWWGIGSDLLKQGKDIVIDYFETEEQKEARRKKEEACKICNEGSGVSGGAIPINKKLYEKAKEIVYPQYKKASAYRSMALIKKYKELGGKFKEDGERKLQRWMNEEWEDIGNKDYPVFRPTKRITKDTPLTPEEIDPKNLKSQIEEKQKIKGKKNLKPFKVKGGALYAKDKYQTAEKELTPVEKAKVKEKFGEKNPEIAEIQEEPMGDDDIRKYFPNAKILKYSELSKYNDITELLPKNKSFFFLLYERKLNVGHWVLLSRYSDNGINTIEFFCSYGSKIDAPLSWTPVGMRVQLGQDKPYLSMLLDKSNFNVVYNKVQYQSKRSNIATCGAYDTLRAGELVRHNTTLAEFNEMLEDVKEATGLSYDEIVSNLVDMR